MVVLDSSGIPWMYVGTAATLLVTVGYYFKRFFGKDELKSLSSLPSSAGSTINVNSIQQDNSIKAESDKNTNYPGGKVVVCFGSQTGTAETFAQQLVDEGKDHGFDTRLMDLEDFEADSFLEEPCVIFVVATYGEGDPTDNAAGFVKWLKNKGGDIEENAMKNIKYTGFGLGNRQYEHYNAMGRLLNKKMKEHGATSIYEYGEGDDDGTLEEDFETWKENLWSIFKKELIGESAEIEQTSVVAKPHVSFTCNFLKSPEEPETIKKTVEECIQNSNRHYAHAIPTKVIVHKELRKCTKDGSTIHMELDIKNSNLKYRAADNLAVLPENNEDIVTRLASALSYKLDQWFDLEPLEESNKERYPFPTPTTIRECLTYYLDINGAPRRNVLSQLSFFATDENEKERLLYLSSKDGKDEYHKWVIDEHRNLVDVVEEFPSLQVPLENLIHMVPSLQPRYYTISSSDSVHPNRIHITVSVITEEKSDGRQFRGVCSSYLERQKLNDEGKKDLKEIRSSRPGEQGKKFVRSWPSVRVFIRDSSFRLPSNPENPIVMIGPGTGIAPMRAFLQERKHQALSGHNVGKNILYFGCRNKERDYIYEEELESYKQEGYLDELHLAFSRDQQNKVYVQHLIQAQGDKIWDLVENQNAYFYVCGATSMGNDVHQVLESIAQTHGSLTTGEANNLLKTLQSEGRYVQELWS